MCAGERLSELRLEQGEEEIVEAAFGGWDFHDGWGGVGAFLFLSFFPSSFDLPSTIVCLIAIAIEL